MESKNNGKIAIAIVAMFVIALSVVGFTYAYFVATVEGNTGVKNVDVVAGRLEVLYSQSNKLQAENIVPGWISDSNHYYDPVYSTKVLAPTTSNGTTTYKIVAIDKTVDVTCTDGTTAKPYACSDTGVSTPVAANGITAPVQFSVTNTENNRGDNHYIIRLNVTTNGFGATDKSNLKVTVKKVGTNSDTVLWSGTLAASGTQIVVPAAELLQAGNNTNSYKIYVTYVNANATQNDPANEGVMNSENKSLVVTADIIGVASNDGGTTWVDSDGSSITFPGYETGLSAYTDYSVAPNNGLTH